MRNAQILELLRHLPRQLGRAAQRALLVVVLATVQDASAKSCMDSDRAYQYELPMNRSLHAYACEGAHFLYDRIIFTTLSWQK